MTVTCEEPLTLHRLARLRLEGAKELQLTDDQRLELVDLLVMEGSSPLALDPRDLTVYGMAVVS